MTILVCDDDREIVDAIEIYLLQEGYKVEKAYDGQQALEVLKNKKIDLMVIDVMMPKLDGIRATFQARKTSSIPIIILSAKTEDADKILGLNVGADDYVAKPFSMMELMSRIKALFRRREVKEEKNDTYQVGPLYVSISKHVVKVKEEEITCLTYKEFELLSLLLQHQETVLSRDQILQSIWGYDFDGESRTVDVHVRTLRQKLGEAGKLIETVRGFGYKIGKQMDE